MSKVPSETESVAFAPGGAGHGTPPSAPCVPQNDLTLLCVGGSDQAVPQAGIEGDSVRAYARRTAAQSPNPCVALRGVHLIESSPSGRTSNAFHGCNHPAHQHPWSHPRALSRAHPRDEPRTNCCDDFGRAETSSV